MAKQRLKRPGEGPGVVDIPSRVVWKSVGARLDYKRKEARQEGWHRTHRAPELAALLENGDAERGATYRAND